jgi:hypothetical protein
VDKGQQRGVPAAPNESKIRGEILKIQRGPDGPGYIWEVKVNESEDSGGARNFARAYVGKPISIYIHPDMKKKFKENDSIEARIFFQGDERSGAFFLIDDDVHKL